MASYNRVTLLGNLTRDIELKHAQSGLAIANIGLAVNDRIKRGDEWVDEATFVDCTLFGKTAEIASQYLSKGRAVLIEGRLKLDTWETDGQRRSKLSVVGDKMVMVGSPSDGGGSQQRSQAGSAPKQEWSAPSQQAADEIPF